MLRMRVARRVSLLFLYVIPFLVLPLFVYRPGRLAPYVLACATQYLLMAVAVWILAGDAVENSAKPFLLPGVFFVATEASAELAAYMGPPPWPPDATWVATLADQHTRFVALLVAGLLGWASFNLLTSRLAEAGERTFAVLGRAATAVSTPLFILFTISALVVYGNRASLVAASGAVPEWWQPLAALSLVWLAVYAALTHLAAALYAMALARVGLLGSFGRAFFVILGTMGAIGALISISAQNKAIKEAFYPFMIPAVPLLLPYLIGVGLLRRASEPAA